MVTYIENIPIPEPLDKNSGYCEKHLIFILFFSSQELNDLVKLKTGIATLQYQPKGPHVLFYMTTTKANLVWEQEHTHARQA